MLINAVFIWSKNTEIRVSQSAEYKTVILWNIIAISNIGFLF